MNLRVLCAGLLVFAGVVELAQASSPISVTSLEVGENYMLYLPVRINGSEFRCNLDSGGGDRIYLDKSKALAAGIQPATEGRSAGPQSGSMTVDSRARVSLEIGGLKLPDQELVMQNRPHPNYACGVGMSVLKAYVLELSYAPPQLRIYNASGYRYPKHGHAVPFAMEGGNLFVDVTLVFPVGDPIPAHLAVDTGGGRPACYLSKSFTDKHDVMHKVSRAVPDFWSGTSKRGEPRVMASRLNELKAGDLELNGPIFYSMQTHAFGGGTEPDGMLCPGFLRRFGIVIDFPHSRIFLEPTSHFQDDIPFDASGTLIYRWPDKSYRVWKVVEQSPASEAGLKEGDTVLEFNGRPVSQLSIEKIRADLEAEGHERSIRVKRGEEVIELKLKLRKLI